MPRRESPSFHFEKTRLLHRNKQAEFWEGTVDGRPVLVKRFSGSQDIHWQEFVLQGQIHHASLLTALHAGIHTGGRFAYSMPLDFVPSKAAGIQDAWKFAIQVLSLAAALSSKGLSLHWDAGLLLEDKNTGRIFLPGISATMQKSARDLRDCELRTMVKVRSILNGLEGVADLDKILRKWERRKENPLSGCLRDLVMSTGACLDVLPAWFEMPRTRELELVTGLLQLVRQSRGRAMLFTSDPGGGKSSLLSQIYRSLRSRDVNIVFHQASPETKAFHSIRRLLDQFFDYSGSYQAFRSDFAPARRVPSANHSLDVPEEALVADFLQMIAKLHVETDKPLALVIDDLDNFDPQSLSVMARLTRSLQSSPLLFVASGTRKLEGLPESLVTLPLETLPVSSFEQSCVAPLWKPEQKRSVIRSVYRQTRGNILLFQVAFLETLRRGTQSVRWEEEWSLSGTESPSVPDSTATLYFKKATELSDQESRFLETAAVQGCVFEPGLIDVPDHSRQELLESLREKGILAKFGEQFGFLRPVLADHFYERIDGSRRTELHLRLAELLSRSDFQQAEIARHFLRAGRPLEALEHACRAAAELRFNTAQVVLPILVELQQFSEQLDRAQVCRLHREKADLLFRWGKYPAAVEAYREALRLTDQDPSQRFELQVRIAESLYQNNEIHAALHALRELGPRPAPGLDPALLIRFYFCRGACGWHRGKGERHDFEKGLALAEEQQDYDALACGHRQLAELSLRGGSLADARNLASKALRFARKAGSHAESGHAYRILGVIAWHRSLHRTAGRILQRSIRHFNKAGSLAGVARVWSLLGNVHVERCQFKHAIAAFQRASALFSQLDHPLEVSLAQFNLGLVYIEQGRLKEAEKIYLRCKSIDRKAGNKRYYAYDLRALAVAAILRGFHRKASTLLRRTLEICHELRAENDVLQTQMIQFMNELEQKNYRHAKPLADTMRQLLETVREPMARAEIHYLLAHYHGYINETEKALEHLKEALDLSQKIHYSKLIGMCLILKLIFRNAPPGRKDRELHRAIACFRRSQNELRLSDYLLRLYQAYPSLVHEREHAARLARMEKLYRQIRNRSKHRMVRELVMRRSRGSAPEPLYDWWYSLLQTIHGEGDLESRIHKTLDLLSEEFHAASAGLWLRDTPPIQFHVPAEPIDDTSRDFRDRVWRRLIAAKDAVILDTREEPEFAGHAWTQWHDIRSVLAIPLSQDQRVLGMWYFERWGAESVFTRKDLGKASFFSMASLPAILNALQAEVAEEVGSHRQIDTGFVGKSKSMQTIQQQIARLAPLDISVLILGESGTGKELIARSLHRNSPRASGPFLAINCSAIPEALVESELFGYAKGAFTGASMTKQGFIEQASGGTLFLDEVGDLSPAAQAKLLRVMQEKEIQRLGETSPRKVDVRFLFATHKDLQKMVREGSYRQDLFYRISVYSLAVPPLRERPEDIPLLLTHFTEKYARSFSKGRVQYSTAAMQTLCDYSWPGNVREMENAVQSLLVNTDSGGKIELKDLPPQITTGATMHAFSGVTLEEARQEFEREFLRLALKRNSWNKTQTARELGITRQGLMQMIQRLGLSE